MLYEFLRTTDCRPFCFSQSAVKRRAAATTAVSRNAGRSAACFALHFTLLSSGIKSHGFLLCAPPHVPEGWRGKGICSCSTRYFPPTKNPLSFTAADLLSGRFPFPKDFSKVLPAGSTLGNPRSSPAGPQHPFPAQKGRFLRTSPFFCPMNFCARALFYGLSLTTVSPAILPKTFTSQMALPPRRFAPWMSPVTSPAAYRPAMG